MSKSVFAVAALGAAGVIGAYAMSSHPEAAHASIATSKPAAVATDVAHPVVLELYQSQGCSSCPPANAVLNQVADQPGVLALNFSVTYWDQLGWKDIFAQPAFTARQWDYARSGGRGNVQTPQLIVDGKAAILGSRRGEVDAAIAAHRPLAGAPEIAATASAVDITKGSVATSATVWLVDYDPRNVPVQIRNGENGGRTLSHRNIVHKLTALGNWTGGAAHFTRPAAGAGLAQAVLVQAGKGGEIVAARKI